MNVFAGEPGRKFTNSDVGNGVTGQYSRGRDLGDPSIRMPGSSHSQSNPYQRRSARPTNSVNHLPRSKF